MKTTIRIILALAVVNMATSCSTTEKFTVKSAPGTKLYSPDNTSRPANGLVYSGNEQITIPSDMFCGYMLAKPEGYDYMIPFGIDCRGNSHTGTKAAHTFGFILTSVGLGGVLIGSGAAIAATSQEDEENSELFGKVTAIGGAGVLIGFGLGMPAYYRLQQTSYDYNFGYVKNQTFNLPNLSNTLLKPNKTKEDLANPQASNEAKTRKKASSGTSAKGTAKAATGTKSSKTRSDNAKKVAGTYSGTGKLYLKNTLDESYSNVAVLMEYADKNHVLVRILESDEDFFAEPLNYEVKRNKDGSYLLTLQNFPNATITVYKNGQLSFSHDAVNIDDEIYKLTISAKKSAK